MREAHGCFKRRRSGTDTPLEMGAEIRAVRAPQGAPGSSGSVLLVDDEPLLLRALQRILRADGHRIALAESSEQAEEGLADPELDVVVLPAQEDEFTCMSCFLVKHRSQIAEESGPGFICLECAA